MIILAVILNGTILSALSLKVPGITQHVVCCLNSKGQKDQENCRYKLDFTPRESYRFEYMSCVIM